MNGKYVSCAEIIRQVYRDNKYTHELSLQSAIEWSAEALDLIGAPRAYVRTIDAVDIENYRGELPCNFHEMLQCSGLTDSGQQFPMRGATNTFHPVFDSAMDCATSSSSSTTVVSYVNPVGTDADGNPVFNFSNDGSVTLNKNLTALPHGCEDATYTLNSNYIFTNFKEGKVLMSYWSFPVDKDGLPMVPDQIKFKKAVAAYIKERIDYQLWRADKISDKIYNKSETEWLWYVGAAGNAGRMPNIDQMESWKNQAMRLIPKMNMHRNFFKELGNQQQLNF